MCFSPTASFVTGGALGVLGTATLQEARKKSEYPLAAVPLLFALQQVIEGFIWLSFGSPRVLAVLTNTYAAFSHILWPFFVPLAIFLVEPDKYRRKMIFGLLLLGTVLSSYILFFIILNPIQAEVAQKSIEYSYQGQYPMATLGLYLMTVTMAPLFSSYKMLKVFGVALFLSALVAYQSYETTFFSVWCFFAAGLSVIIYAFFKYARMSRVREVFEVAKRRAIKRAKKLNHKARKLKKRL